MQLQTQRLLLRRYDERDIPALVQLLSAREVAATTLRIPHPYTTEHAREFLRQLTSDPSSVRLGIFLAEHGRLVGGVGLHTDEMHQRAELGYWIGHPYWGNGYATEAAREVLRYGFEDLKLNRIFAGVFGGNDASVRVLVKLGMRYEGTAKQHYRKWGKFLDDIRYAVLAEEWRQFNNQLK